MKSSVLLVVLAAAASARAANGFVQQRQSSNWTVGQTVQTNSGPVSGHAAKNQSAVSEYLGIPYAQAPVGDLRFAAPVAFHGTASLNGSSYVGQVQTQDGEFLADSHITGPFLSSPTIK